MLFGKYLNKYYLKYGIFFIIGIVALVAIDWFQLYVPEFLGDIVDLFGADGIAEEHIKEVVDLTIKVILVSIGLFFGRIIWRLSIFYASQKVESNLREEMFVRAESLSQKYYHTNKVGNIISWFSTDVETIQEFLGWGTIMIVDAFFLSVLVLIKMFRLDVFLTLITLIPLCLIIAWGAIGEIFWSKMWETRQKNNDRLYDFTQESMTGIRVIKAFVKETQQLHEFAKIARKNKDSNVRFARLSIIFDASIEIIIAAIVAIILGVGGWTVYMVSTGQPLFIFNHEVNLTAAKLVTFYAYFDTLIWPMIALGQIFSMRSRAKTSLKRVTNFLDQEVEICDTPESVDLVDVKGDIEIKDFNFKYPSNELDSLKNINIKIKAGEKIGIVGKIGSGKTTLINSLLRIYNIDKNKVFIDGVDLMNIKLTSLRDSIAYVPQDNFLFSEKISYNIGFSKDDCSEEEIKKAAQFACIDENIESFPQKYDTVSGERGTTLSGGQKQRISIARAYLKNSPIMIFDDSFSSVDMNTEEAIFENLLKERENKTTIVVATRISTVSRLDRIIVLNDGEIEGFDTHENLLKTSPTYKTMVYLQKLEDEIKGGE